MGTDQHYSLTTRDVADRLDVSPMTVLRWVERGTLPAIKVGQVCRISAEDFERFLEEHRQGGPGAEASA